VTRKKRSWGEFFPQQKRQPRSQVAKKINPAQLAELKELAALRQVNLTELVISRYQIRRADWIYELQAQALIKEMRDGRPK